METFMTVHRGEVWYVDYGNTIGSEEGFGRPMVIFTSEAGCKSSPTLMGIPVTTNEAKSRVWINVFLPTMKRKSWALCNQVTTIDKSRLKNRMVTLSSDEIRNIEIAVRTSTGMASEEVKKVEDEAKKVADKERSQTEELVRLEFEATYYRKMYEKAMDRLVESNFTKDIQQMRKKETVKIEEKPVVENEAAEPAKIDLNRATTEELRSIGLSDRQADMIERNRPFNSMEDIKILPSITTICYKILSTKAVVLPVEKKQDKVNINTATEKDLLPLGIAVTTAQKFIAWRKNQPKLNSLDDVARFSRMGKCNLKKLEGKIVF